VTPRHTFALTLAIALTMAAVAFLLGFAVGTNRADAHRPRVTILANNPTTTTAPTTSTSTTDAPRPATSVASRGGHRDSPGATRTSGPVLATRPAAPGGDLVRRIAWCESGFDARAVNRASGAGGLMQWLPSTWRSMGYAARYGVARAELLDEARQWQAAYDAVARFGTRPWNMSRRCWA
jgi:soluble lytic murein transglycosylase-like protein